jgi:hypothetical protein
MYYDDFGRYMLTTPVHPHRHIFQGHFEVFQIDLICVTAKSQTGEKGRNRRRSFRNL